MAIIELKNVNTGGIADSDLLGSANSMSEIVGIDLHSKPGFLKANQKLTQEIASQNIIDDLIKTGVSCSDGNVYLFGSTNGKIWKRTPAGVWTLEATVSPASGGPGIVGSAEYQGFIYYGMEEKLGRWRIGDPWSARNDDFNTFRNGNALYHPMKALNLVLYIGDANVVCQVDSSRETITYNNLVGIFQPGEQITGGTSGATAYIDSDDTTGEMIIKEIVGAFVVGEVITGQTSGATADISAIVDNVFSENALDLPTQYIIKCLGQLGTDLLIGTVVNINVVATQIFRWNTWSTSFTNSDPIPEVGINSFLATDNFVIVNAGTKGNLYIYDGSTLDLYKQVKGNWDGSDKATVYPEASFNFNGLPLFGLSTETGDPTIMGIYSLGRANRNYPYVLNCEYLISSLDVANIKIGTIIGCGDIFLVSYQKANGDYGVDALDLTAKFDGAYLKTRVMTQNRMVLTNFSSIQAGYSSLPAGTDIEFEKKVNYGTYLPVSTVPADNMTDADRQIKYCNIDIGEATTLQMKISLRTNGNASPELDFIYINIKDNG